MCLFLFLFLLLWKADPRNICMIYVRECCARVLFWEFYSVMSYTEVFKPFWVYFCLWGYVPTSLIYVQVSNFPNTTCWRDWFFSIVYSCLHCWRWIDCRHVGLFLSCLFCSIDPYILFFFFFGQYHDILITQLCNIVSSLGGLCL